MSFKLPYSEQHYSQWDEDGVILHLINALHNPNKKCVEIGWGNDRRHVKNNLAVNCTQNLIQNHNYSCVAFDLKKQISVPNKVQFYQQKVTPDNCKKVLKLFDTDVDFFSLDIDGYDFPVMEELMNLNFRPSIICAEMNKRFGYNTVASFPYVENCNHYNKQQYHGVSFLKYKNYLEALGYKFFTVNSNSVNIFFYDPNKLDESKLSNVILNCDENITNKITEEFKTRIKTHEFWKDYYHDIFK